MVKGMQKILAPAVKLEGGASEIFLPCHSLHHLSSLHFFPPAHCPPDLLRVQEAGEINGVAQNLPL